MTLYSDQYSGTRPYRLDLIVTQGEQSIAGNYTDLNCTLSIIETDPNWLGTFDGTASNSSYLATIDGASVSGNFTYDFRNDPATYPTRTLRTWTKRVYHDANGNKTAAVSASSSATLLGSAALSGSFSPSHITQKPSTPAVSTESAVTGSGFTLNWADPADWGGDNTSDFMVQVSTSPTFISAVESYPVIGNTLTLGSRFPNTAYYEQHYASNEAGSSGWSPTNTITTPIVAPATPPLASASAIGETTATLSLPDPTSWGGEDTSQFDVLVSTSSEFTGATPVSVSGNTKVLSGLANATRYYFKHRAKNSAGPGGYSVAKYFITAVAAPSTPGAPSISGISGTSARADWADPADWGGDNTSSFDLYLATNSGLSGATVIPQGDNDHTWTGLTPGDQYWAGVIAKNSGGSSPMSPVTGPFTMLDFPSAPQNPVVSDIKAKSVTLAVTAPVSNGGAMITAYRLQIATDAGFMALVYNVASAALTRYISGLDPSTEYSYRIAAINSVGTGAYAESTFATKSAAVIQKASAVKEITDIYIQKSGTPKLVTRLLIKSGGAWRD